MLARDATGAAREGRLLAAFSSSVCRMPAWNEWWRRLLRAESAQSCSETQVGALEHARAASSVLVGDTAPFPDRSTSA